MKRLGLLLWLVASAFLLLLCLALAYMSLMLGAVHWDRGLSLGLGLALVAIWLLLDVPAGLAAAQNRVNAGRLYRTACGIASHPRPIANR